MSDDTTVIDLQAQLREQLGQALERDLATLRERADALEALRGPMTIDQLAQRAQALALSLCALELGRIADVLVDRAFNPLNDSIVDE